MAQNNPTNPDDQDNPAPITNVGNPTMAQSSIPQKKPISNVAKYKKTVKKTNYDISKDSDLVPQRNYTDRSASSYQPNYQEELIEHTTKIK